MEEISREGYLAYAGHKKTAELQPIYQHYERVLGPEALDLTLDAFRSSADGTEERRSAQLLLEWEIESQAAKPLAALDEREIAWENSAMVRSPDGRVIQYQAAPIEIANTKDRAARLALDAARAKLVKNEHAPLRLERLQREKEYIESLGIARDYNSSFEAVTGISLSELADNCDRFLRDTKSMWDDTLRGVLRSSLGIKASEAKRADGLALFRAAQYDDAFPGADISYQKDAQRQTIVDSWPADVDDSAARRDWGFAPRYDEEQAFNEYLIPTIRKQYARGPGGNASVG